MMGARERHTARQLPSSGSRVIDFCTRQSSDLATSTDDEYAAVCQHGRRHPGPDGFHAADSRPEGSSRVIDFRTRERFRAACPASNEYSAIGQLRRYMRCPTCPELPCLIKGNCLAKT